MPKCVPGPTTWAICPKCYKDGTVTGYKNPMLDMQCECGNTWRTISSLCSFCHKPSETPHFVDCKYCKDIKKESIKDDSDGHSTKRRNSRKKQEILQQGNNPYN
jgi:hypothetical protein